MKVEVVPDGGVNILVGARKASVMLKFCSTAGTLGMGWFAVLLIPRITREWLLANVPQNAACLVVAVLCRRFIERADTLGVIDHLKT